MRSARVAVVLDVCCVLVFVVIGRASHTKGESLAGIASTSWPFLCRSRRRLGRVPRLAPPAGAAPRRACCLAVHGGARHDPAGRLRPGHAVAFIIVALVFLGLFLLGWRLLCAGSPRWQGAPNGPSPTTADRPGGHAVRPAAEHRRRGSRPAAERPARVEAGGDARDLGQLVAAEHLDRQVVQAAGLGRAAVRKQRDREVPHERRARGRLHADVVTTPQIISAPTPRPRSSGSSEVHWNASKRTLSTTRSSGPQPSSAHTSASQLPAARPDTPASSGLFPISAAPRRAARAGTRAG